MHVAPVRKLLSRLETRFPRQMPIFSTMKTALGLESDDAAQRVALHRMVLVFTICTETSANGLRIHGILIICARPRTAVLGLSAAIRAELCAVARGIICRGCCAVRGGIGF